MSLISIANLTFAHDGAAENLFENVSFQIDANWKLGFIGRNGRGKTTFLKLLLNQYQYQGVISASVKFDYFPFAVPRPERPVREALNVLAPGHEPWRLAQEMAELELPPALLARPFKHLSGGEKTKILLAALFVKENNFLLLDEPTDHLDLKGRKAVSGYLAAKAKGYILVSHDRRFLDGCVDHVLSLGRANIEVQRGNYSSWRQNQAYQDGFELERGRELNRELKRLGQAVKKTAAWADRIERSKIGGHVFDRGFVGHKAAKMMRRSKEVAKRRQKALEEKSSLLKNLETTGPLALTCLKHHAKRLIEVKDLSIFHDAQVVFEGLNLTVNQGDRLALLGKNGCGKSSLLKLIAGEKISCTGVLRLASGLVISYVPQEVSDLRGSLKDFAGRLNIEDRLFRAILHKLGFRKSEFDHDLAEHSDGQKKKVLLAGGLSQKAHLYVWDEPLNYLDVLARQQIEDLIKAHKPTMLLAEHDQAFLEATATEMINLS